MLLNVYEEYKKFCEKQRRDIKIVGQGSVLQIKKNETVTGRRSQVIPLPNTYATPSTQGAQFGAYTQELDY